MSQMIMPSDAERETLVVVVEVQLLREGLIGRTRGTVGGAGGTARRQWAETVEAARAAVLRKALRKPGRSSVTGGLLLLRQLLVGAAGCG
jgi:hypothetical protein